MRFSLKNAKEACVEKIEKILPFKRKIDSAETKEAAHKFHTLTPKDDAPLGVYESALDFVFTDPNVKNVAVSGAYGSGKSTIVKSYKTKKNYGDRFLHISMARFQPEGKEAEDMGIDITAGQKSNYKASDDDKGSLAKVNRETILEGKIINQLLHQIPAKNISQTNFRIKDRVPFTRCTVICVALGATFGIYTLHFSSWASFWDTVTTGWLRNLFRFSAYPEMRLITGAIFLFSVGVLTYRLANLLAKHKIRKATVSGLEIEIFNNSNESFFDKYLNEVLYLFKQIEQDVIVFEDIDRYDSSIIFERLHEINRLVNKNRKDKPLRFFFLLKDDIFESKDRTKFFDFIIPIVPYIDGSNSYDKFIECFEEIGFAASDRKENDSISKDFLQGLSLYIDDMRILQNICNEFLIYYNCMKPIEPDADKMLALVAYKNLFPQDFAKLQLEQGFVYEIIGDKRGDRNSKSGKERLIASEKARLDLEIANKEEELDSVKNETLPLDILAELYARRICGYSFNSNWDADTCRQQIESRRNNPGYKDAILEYDNFIAYAEANPESREKRITRLEKELQELCEEQDTLMGKKVCQLISRENIDEFFTKTKFISETGAKDENFNIIKDSPYFPILKYLVREGYIDESYTDYMTYFHENSLSAGDKKFLRSVRDKKAKGEAYPLEKPELVASLLSAMYYDQEEILNYELFKSLLADYVGNNKHTAKTKKFIEYIREKHLYDFLVGYAIPPTEIDNLIKVIGAEWIGFINDYIHAYNLGDTPSHNRKIYEDFIRRFTYELLVMVGTSSESMSFVDEDSKSALVKFISNDEVYVSTDATRIQELADGIKQFGIRFSTLSFKVADYESEIDLSEITTQHEVSYSKLSRLIYENNSYAINYANINSMLTKYYDLSGSDNTPSNWYTIIMSDEESPMAKYIGENIDDFVNIIVSNCNGMITDLEKNAVSIINNEDVAAEKRKTYISYLTTVIPNLHDINDTNLWEELLKNHKALKYTPENVVDYFANCRDSKFDDVLVSYINAQGKSIILDSCFADDERKDDFFEAIILATALDDAIYEGFVEQSSIKHEDFEITDFPIEKLQILDKHGLIGMTKKSLATMREHYQKYLYKFICNHIEDYIKIVSDKTVFDFDEMLALLDKEIAAQRKIDLLNLTQKPVSIKGKKYPDKLSAYILSNNYDDTDFEHLVIKYVTYGEQTKTAIVDKAFEQKDLLQSHQDIVSRLLITDILSRDFDFNDKFEVFKNFAPAASKAEIKKWVNVIGISEFLDVYDRSKRPRFDATDTNATVLEILENRGDIKEYRLDGKSDKYIIRRPKL